MYSKTCLERPLKIDKTKVLRTDDSLMQVESIAEYSLGAFCNTFDLHEAIISLEKHFLSFWGGRFRLVLMYTIMLYSRPYSRIQSPNTNAPKRLY